MFAPSSASTLSLFWVLASTALLLPLVSAHGGIISHFIREAGDKSLEVCGQEFNDDRTGVRDGNNVFGQILDHSLISGSKWKDPDACNWRLCSGLQYEDNVANTYYYPIGAIVPINVFILNANSPLSSSFPRSELTPIFSWHLLQRHAGIANVSIVDTKTNEVVGSPLIEWTDGKYAEYDNVNTCPDGPAVAETAFNVTIPDLGDKCTKGGDCVVQWYWYSESANNQTFNSCIDFVQPFGGSALPAMVEGRPDIFEHKAYCHPADQTTTTVYDTATLLNEASSPKTLVSIGGDDAAALPTLTTTPVESPSATTSAASDATSFADSSAVASASASPSPSSAPATTQDVIASDSAPTSTAETYEAAPTSTPPPVTSAYVEETAAPTTTPYAEEEEVSAATFVEDVSPTTTANSGAIVVQTPVTTEAAAVCETEKAINAVAAETVTINETVTVTAAATPLATTTVIEKVYVFMEAISTSTAEIAAATPVKRRHVSGSGARRLSSHH
ncbi:hypothetical protein BDY24DRAFT_440884 [Mrakia frigida]|uniref:uncharacterized protein n=1 Tax=Mrakia frigida TaxID=29902 RepID=UPI003FCC0835